MIDILGYIIEQLCWTTSITTPVGYQAWVMPDLLALSWWAVSAVGLWLATPWGAVVWLTTVVSMAVIELMFPTIYGGNLLVVGVQAAFLAAYLALAWMAARERPP